MGSLQAQDIQNVTDFKTALSWHLSGNHFPPIPQAMIPVAEKAIENAQLFQVTGDTDLLDEIIALPGDITWKGEVGAPVRAIMEDLHLWDFVQPLDEDEEDF